MIFAAPMAVVNGDMHRRMAQVIRTAAVRSHGSIGAACIDMDVRQPHLNAALDGERSLPVGFLSLPPKFWFWMVVGVVEEFGIPQEFAGLSEVFGFGQRKHMVKARMDAQKVKVG
jgi:hypothetical protein